MILSGLLLTRTRRINAGQTEATDVLALAQPYCYSLLLFLADVNVAFQQSAHKVLLDDDNLLPLLHLTIEYHGKDHKGLLFSNCLFSASSAFHHSPSTETVVLDLRDHLV